MRGLFERIRKLQDAPVVTMASDDLGWTALVSDNVRHAFLPDVMVHPDFQRRGIGRQVVLRAVEQMALKGITYVHVDCAPDRAGFYARCGFKIGAGGWLDPTKRSLGGEAC